MTSWEDHVSKMPWLIEYKDKDKNIDGNNKHIYNSPKPQFTTEAAVSLQQVNDHIIISPKLGPIHCKRAYFEQPLQYWAEHKIKKLSVKILNTVTHQQLCTTNAEFICGLCIEHKTTYPMDITIHYHSELSFVGWSRFPYRYSMFNPFLLSVS